MNAADSKEEHSSTPAPQEEDGDGELDMTASPRGAALPLPREDDEEQLADSSIIYVSSVPSGNSSFPSARNGTRNTSEKRTTINEDRAPPQQPSQQNFVHSFYDSEESDGR
jgi:hypothetical protein